MSAYYPKADARGRYLEIRPLSASVLGLPGNTWPVMANHKGQPSVTTPQPTIELNHLPTNFSKIPKALVVSEDHQ